MRNRLKRVVIVGAAFAAASIGLISTSASALPPGTASSGAVTLTPPTGSSDTSFFVAPPSPSFCPGDSAKNGYRVQTFLVSSSVDPATLTYDSTGPVAPAGTTAFPLFSAGGTPYVDGQTAINTGQILVPVEPFSFGVFLGGVLPPGVYNFGFACTLGPVTTKFWTSSVTITADAVNGGVAGLRYALVTSPPPDVPEVPFAVLLPASAIGLLGGAALVARKRRRAVPVA